MIGFSFIIIFWVLIGLLHIPLVHSFLLLRNISQNECVSSFNHSPTEGLWGCFHLGPIMNIWMNIMNIWVWMLWTLTYKSLRERQFSFFWDKRLRVWFLGCMVLRVLTCSPGCCTALHVCQQCLSLSASSAASGGAVTFYCSYSDRYITVSHCSFHLNFPND